MIFSSPIIQCVSQLLAGDPGVLNGIGRVGVTERSLNRCDISGILNEVKNNIPLGKIAFIASFDAPYKFEF